MIRTAIISLTILLTPGGTIAQASASSDGALLFADKHVAFIADRCPSQVRAYEALEPNRLHSVLASVPDEVGISGVLGGYVTGQLSQTDIHFGSLVATTPMAIADSLLFMGMYRAEAGVDEVAFVEVFELRKMRVEAVLALNKCIWPSSGERGAISESQWAEPFARIAEGVCDIHFFAMVQRYVDTPIAQMTPAERQIVGENIVSEHDHYLEASKDASQCGEFL